jgi:TetR/AcrR family transcriptional regulator of autoinduction and epiphytic fitness
MLHPLSQKKISKRESILQGAIRAFETEGYDGASMDRISELAGASKRTVYNYFRSKEELLFAVIDDLLSEQRKLKSIRYEASKPLRDQLRSFVDAELYLVTDSTRLTLAKVLTSIFVKDAALCEEANKNAPSPNADLQAWIRAACDDGRLKVEHPELATKVFHGMIEGIIQFPALFRSVQSKDYYDPYIEEAIAMFLSHYQTGS